MPAEPSPSPNVSVSSLAGLLGHAPAGVYTASKFAVVGMMEQDFTVLVQYARFLAAGVDDLQELLEESRSLECKLPIVFVDIEHAALRSRIRGSLCFVDRRSNTVNVEDACKCEAAESGTYDRDWSIHSGSCVAQEPNQRATACG